MILSNQNVGSSRTHMDSSYLQEKLGPVVEVGKPKLKISAFYGLRLKTLQNMQE